MRCAKRSCLGQPNTPCRPGAMAPFPRRKFSQAEATAEEVESSAYVQTNGHEGRHQILTREITINITVTIINSQQMATPPPPLTHELPARHCQDLWQTEDGIRHS